MASAPDVITGNTSEKSASCPPDAQTATALPRLAVRGSATEN
ncbi:hypothetical protein [Prauserella cavernicola]|nr:hypothetical protein [Prauserella cavernicola]